MRRAIGVSSALLAVAVAVAVALAACTKPAPVAVGALADTERNELFVNAIRDAGYLCDEVVSAVAAEGSRMAWRVVCNDLLVYLASVDVDDTIQIEPLAYSDPARVFPPPDIESQVPRPQP